MDRCTRPHVIINSEGDLRPSAKELAMWLTGKAETVPGLKGLPRGGTQKKAAPKKKVVDFYTGVVV